MIDLERPSESSFDGKRAGTKRICLPPGGRLSYQGQWLQSEAAALLFQTLLTALDWRQLPVRMFGRSLPQPRLTDFHGDSGTGYTYSGLSLHGRGWPPVLADLRDALARETGLVFNTVLCNLYRDGRDYMGWHADDEPELGRNPVVASVSLGAQRRFRLRPRAGRSGEPCELLLECGSLLLMSGDLQHHWQHQLPKALRVDKPRINLTFRQVGG